MGNELAKKYDMPRQHSASGGHECLWKIYQATTKATGEPVSVFVLDLDDFRGLPKNEREQLFDVFRRDIRALKEVSHPYVVKILDVLDENKKLLAFVSERVLCSLSNALHQFKNMPPGPLPQEIVDLRLSEMEVGRGVTHLCEALQYTHYVARRLHLGLSPEAVFMTPQGIWKLGCLGMSITLSANEVGPHMQTLCPHYQSGHTRKAGSYRLEPHLSYTAPEVLQDGTSRISYSADAFSLGCIVYDAFQLPFLVGLSDVSKPLIDVPEFASPSDALTAHQRLHPVNLARIPDSVRDPLERLLALDPQHRPEAAALAQAAFFHSGPVATLRDLDSLCAKDPAAQATAVTSLADKLSQFTPRLQRLTLLPPVIAAATTNSSLWVYAIPLLVKVTENLPRDEGMMTLQDGLKGALALRPPNPQVIFLLGQHMQLLLERTEKTFFMESVYPLLLLALESNVPQLQDQAVKQLCDDNLCQLITPAGLLEDVLPRLGHIIVHTTHMSVRVNCLVCLSKTHKYYGKKVLVEAILPTIKVCMERDPSPAVVMAGIGCYDMMLKDVDADFIGTKILPSLVSLVFLRTLTSSQFEKVATRVSSMLSRVIEARRTEISAGLGARDATQTGVTGSGITSKSRTSSSSSLDSAAGFTFDKLPTSFANGHESASMTGANTGLSANGGSGSEVNGQSASDDALGDWSWLKQALGPSSAVSTTTTTTASNGQTHTHALSNGTASRQFDSGQGLKYDASSNPYQLPGTEFRVSSSSMAVPRPSSSSSIAPSSSTAAATTLSRPPYRHSSSTGSSAGGGGSGGSGGGASSMGMRGGGGMGESGGGAMNRSQGAMPSSATLQPAHRLEKTSSQPSTSLDLGLLAGAGKPRSSSNAGGLDGVGSFPGPRRADRPVSLPPPPPPPSSSSPFTPSSLMASSSSSSSSLHTNPYGMTNSTITGSGGGSGSLAYSNNSSAAGFGGSMLGGGGIGGDGVGIGGSMGGGGGIGGGMMGASGSNAFAGLPPTAQRSQPAGFDALQPLQPIAATPIGGMHQQQPSYGFQPQPPRATGGLMIGGNAGGNGFGAPGFSQPQMMQPLQPVVQPSRVGGGGGVSAGIAGAGGGMRNYDPMSAFDGLGAAGDQKPFNRMAQQQQQQQGWR